MKFDWVPEYVKGKFLVGLVIGLLGGMGLFVLVTAYEVRGFKAWFFEIDLPDHSKEEIETAWKQLADAQAMVTAIQAELAKTKAELEKKHDEWMAASYALMDAQSKTPLISAEELDQLRRDLDAAIKERDSLSSVSKDRDELAAKVKSLTSKLRETSDALAKANKQLAAKPTPTVVAPTPAPAAGQKDSCRVSEAGVRKELRVGGDESWSLLGGDVKIRLKSFPNLGGVEFFSNSKDIEEKPFYEGHSTRLTIGTCEYVFRVKDIEASVGYVLVEFFSL